MSYLCEKKNSRCPKFKAKKKSKLLICAWHPKILARTSERSFSLSRELSTPEEELRNCRIRSKQLTRTVHQVERRPSMPLASDSGQRKFLFISQSIVSDNNLQYFVVSVYT